MTTRLTPDDLGAPLGERATVVQFSSTFCAPVPVDPVRGGAGRRDDRGRRATSTSTSPTTRRSASGSDIDVTPTVLVLDARGDGGAPRVGRPDARSGAQRARRGVVGGVLRLTPPLPTRGPTRAAPTAKRAATASAAVKGASGPRSAAALNASPVSASASAAPMESAIDSAELLTPWLPGVEYASTRTVRRV